MTDLAPHPSPTPTLRRGVPSDAAALAEFAARSFAEAFGESNTAEDLRLHLAHHYGVPQQTRELSSPDEITWLAEVDGRIVGYVQLCRGEAPPCVDGPAPVNLRRFYVDRPWHGRGVADPLMRAALQAVPGLGGRSVWLSVWERNPRGLGFYARHGFADVGEITFTVGHDRQTDRVYQLRLDQALGEAESLQRAIHEDVALLPYDPRWPQRFEHERARLLALAGPLLIEVAHIGSTAVPGLAAKPIIDLMGGVARLADADALLALLAQQGYSVPAEYNASLTDRRWAMRWAQGRRTHHLHLVVHGGPVWQERLHFRDALRTDADLAARYSMLKHDLAHRFRDDREAYTEAKAQFVQAVPDSFSRRP